MQKGFNINDLEEFISELEKNNIQYIVIAGFALDGKRGYLSRPHEDLDILCLIEDKKEVEIIYQNLGYTVKRKTANLIKVQKKEGTSIHLCYVVTEGEKRVTYGNRRTSFPKYLFDNPQKGRIEDIEFNIGPNELLRIWGIQSFNEEDAKYAESLEFDKKIMKEISRTINRDMVHDKG
jgi:hypothetical protein